MFDQKKTSVEGIRIFMILLTVLLVGCSNLKRNTCDGEPFYRYDKTKLCSIHIGADISSNDNRPTAVDLVFIYEGAADSALLGLTGPQWFANKVSLLQRYGQQLGLIHVELVPRSMSEKIRLPKHYYNATQVLMYTNYSSLAGQSVADITLFSDLHIQLKKSNYQLKEMEP